MKNFIGKNIRYLRNQAGYTQESLAHKVGLNRGNIASYEKGTAHPSISKLQEITQFFEIDLNDLVNKDLSFGEKAKQGDFSIINNEDSLKASESFAYQLSSIRHMLNAHKQSWYMNISKYQQVSQTVQRLIRDHEQILDFSEQLLNILHRFVPNHKKHNHTHY